MSKQSNPFFDPEWLRLQQSWLEQLARGTGASVPETGSGEPAWQQAMQSWLDAVADAVPEDSRAMFNSMMGQCRSYYSMNERFTGMFRELAESEAAGDDWEAILARHMEDLKRDLQNGSTAADADAMSPALQASREFWQQASRLLSPEEFLQTGRDSDIQRLFRQYLSMPALGPLREYQEQVRHCLLAWQGYQDKLAEYQSMLQRLGLEAIDRLHARILEYGREGRSIDSLRQLYDLWIDCNEEVFSEYALGEEYAVLYGELVGALMDFRRNSQAVMEELLQYHDMPEPAGTRGLQRLQAEFRETLQESSDENRRMRDELETLKAELRVLREQVGSSGNDDTRGRS